MHSQVRKAPRMTDFHPPLSEQRDAEHKRQVRKLLLAILPAVVGALVYLAWRFYVAH